MIEVVIAAAVRTPIGKFGGSLKDVSATDLARTALVAALKRAGLAGDRVDEVYLGVTTMAECEDLLAPVIARQVLLKAGLPPETVSVTLDRACCSGMTAVQMAYRSLRLQESRVAVAGGAENMSRTPMVIRPLRWGSRLGHIHVRDPLYELGYQDFNPVACDAGAVALELGVGREEQDAWALLSQQRYQAALQRDAWAEETVPVPLPGSKGAVEYLAHDEFPKPDTTLERLSRLPTVYNSPTVTAGNAPGFNDGAAMLVLCTRAAAAALSLPVLATLVDVASVAAAPRQIATVPAQAISRLLERNGLSPLDLTLIEINEAFAAMPLVSTLLLGGGDPEQVQALRERTNVNGGAVALGHPVGASGARILVTLLHELHRRGGGWGVAAICGGLAQGDAVLIRVQGSTPSGDV